MGLQCQVPVIYRGIMITQTLAAIRVSYSLQCLAPVVVLTLTKPRWQHGYILQFLALPVVFPSNSSAYLWELVGSFSHFLKIVFCPCNIECWSQHTLFWCLTHICCGGIQELMVQFVTFIHSVVVLACEGFHSACIFIF